MKKLILTTLLCIFTINLSANSKANLVERKKNFDSKAKFLLSMQDLITSEKLQQDTQSLKDVIGEVDSTYRSGDRDKIKKVLSSGEIKLATFQKEYLTFISTETKELMENYSSQVTQTTENENQKKSKPTVAYTTTKEKSSEYFTIAKADFSNATKFERDGNLQYSIQLYRRALNYTVLAFDKSKFQLPPKFANLSKKVPVEPEGESEVAPIGTNHTPPTAEGKEVKPVNPSKGKK